MYVGTDHRSSEILIPLSPMKIFSQFSSHENFCVLPEKTRNVLEVFSHPLDIHLNLLYCFSHGSLGFSEIRLVLGLKAQHLENKIHTINYI